jgi:pimeloyl-ACP methyl ester carboxylesterase
MLVSKRLRVPLRVAGCRFNYLEGGSESGLPPVLFLHGWSSAAYPFADGLRLLAEHRRVIAPDLPGFNQSLCSTTGWVYEDYADAIFGLARAVNVEAFHLAGHSTGGGVAIMMAARFPQAVRSLTLIDSTGVPLGNRWRVAARKTVELFRQAWAAPLAPQHIPLVTSALGNILFRTRNTWDSLRLPLHLDLRPLLSSVAAPSQVVWAERDATVPLAFGRALAAQLPGAQWICLPGAYHEWSVLRPQLFADTLLSFIRAVEAASPAARPPAQAPTAPPIALL